MKVNHLFLKTESKKPLTPKKRIELVREVGISQNLYLGNLTPRQILIVSEDSLNQFNLNPGDLRENVVVSGSMVNQLDSGDLIEIGDAQIRITFACEPCGYIENLQKGLLRKIEGQRGVLGVVFKSGVISLGDLLEIKEKRAYPRIPYKIIDRFRWLIAQIPEGKVLSYKQIIETLGLWSSVYRALPAFIKASKSELYPSHRITNSKGELIEILPNQSKKLQSEGVPVINNSVDLEKYSWNTAGLYLQRT